MLNACVVTDEEKISYDRDAFMRLIDPIPFGGTAPSSAVLELRKELGLAIENNSNGSQKPAIPAIERVRFELKLLFGGVLS